MHTGLYSATALAQLVSRDSRQSLTFEVPICSVIIVKRISIDTAKRNEDLDN